MKTYEFTIVASGLDREADDFEQRFYDAGCDDATISFQKGHILLDFARDAESMADALVSALASVNHVGAKVHRIEPDPLVSLADIAARSSLSRAASTQYWKGQRGSGFPRPFAKVTTGSPLWHWADVSLWLYERGKVARDTVIEAESVRFANTVLNESEETVRHGLSARLRELEAAI